MTEEGVKTIAEKIRTNCLANTEIQKQHIENIKTNCPRCGGILVVRTSKHGKNIGQKFIGCSNFPRCRYTRHIS